MCTTGPHRGFVNDLELDALARAADSLLARGRVVEADRAVSALERLRALRGVRSTQALRAVPAPRADHDDWASCRCDTSA